MATDKTFVWGFECPDRAWGLGDAIGQVLASVAGIAVSSIAVITVYLIFAMPRGRANGLTFTAG
ncbi:hypothetical protein Aca07nite_86860 [Actinoplanes capillaceus]|uniref:Uncharacterized protein n=1 Tax=Actinoplanes campanulatus TaxID=113559 RepID=A0ABQ3WYQ3_9ACTN|nr:hypothetical protein Aca07nite_86860 [Actinoplanes capillaceus]